MWLLRNVRRMPSKSVLKYGFKADADRLSETYRAELSVSKFDPLDAFKLAAHKEVSIITVDEFAEHLTSGQMAILRNTSKFSAMWMPTADGEKIIIHNNHHSEKRQQSNIMHELAHILLGHEIPAEAAMLCVLTGLHYFNTQQEQEAKFLGGCLQITRPGLLWAMKRNFSDEQISNYFNASLEMVNYRKKITGVLFQRRYSKH